MKSVRRERVLCVCGCARKAVQRHHVVYVQHLRPPPYYGDGGWLGDSRTLAKDTRNLVPVAALCHGNHHARSQPLRLDALPDSAYEFAVEVLGVGPAYEYLRRRYAGDDPRLDTLIR